MMKQLLLVSATLLALGASAHAQQNNGGNANRNTNTNGNTNTSGAVLPLPEGVEKVISIDAFNVLLAQTNNEGERGLSSIIVRHVYSGGIARLFGGDIVPTSQFVSPGLFGGNGNQNGNQNGANNGVQNGGGQNGFGGGFGNGGTNNFGGASSFGAFQMRRFGRRN